MPTRSRAAIGVVILLAGCSRAFALNPSLDINQYAHAAWTIRDGFFTGGVNSIAQTPDGYLWVGTESGLFRFDGVRTVRWQPPSGEQLASAGVQRLLVTRDGRLWIGTVTGLATWKDGTAVTYAEFAGLYIGSLLEDSHGTVWVGTVTVPNARLCAIDRAIRCVGEDGRFGSGIFSLFEEGGRLWVGATSGLWRWSPGDPTRYAMPSTGLNHIIKLGDGPLLLAMSGGLRQLVGERSEPYPIPGIGRPFTAIRMLVDRDGGMWIATGAGGLVHVHEGGTDQFTRSDGLSGEAVRSLFEDREGNIWVGTADGLDRFRERPITIGSFKPQMSTGVTGAILPARDGSVWVGTSDGLIRQNAGRATTYRTRDGLPHDTVETLFQDSAGRIVVATLGGLATFQDGNFTPVRSATTRVVYNIVEDREEGLWVNDQEHGLIHLIGDRVVEQIPWPALGHDDHSTALVADRTRNGLWLGFYNGGVIFWKDGAIRASYGIADGLGAGRVSELHVDRDGAVWAATAGGLSRIIDNRVATLTTRHGLPCDRVYWTIEQEERTLWLMTACGLARIDRDQLAAWSADPNRSVKSAVFDSSDGVGILSNPIGYNPPAAWLDDGRLWFAMLNAVGIMDPHHLPVNSLTPPVHIEQIVADRTTYDTTVNANTRVQLPPRVHDVQIDYTALSLAAPEKVKFRYKLEGIDRDWRDAGNRRQAFYTDLPPREYRFRVAAANNSGVWNEEGAIVDFVIAPAYYQTTWFLALSIATMAAVVFGAHRLRLRVVEKHQREISALNERLMKAQEQERMRIAGELHDGVMQEMLAVTMMLGTAKRKVPGNSDAQATIDKIQDKMIRVGTDIRRLSHDLHPPILQEAGLPKALQSYCDEFSATSGIAVSCEADESASELSRGAALALFRILQEALGNAAKHARAKRVAVRLTRSNSSVTLAVSDDGVGFDRSLLDTSRGLGLITMRERAGQLNGTFEFNSAPGRGTTIRVVIPFR